MNTTGRSLRGIFADSSYRLSRSRGSRRFMQSISLLIAPVAPEPGTPWRDPDRPRPRRVAAAAIDGLVAMVEEAARRDDPDQQLTAKVTKAAQRLRER